ncbi:putative porin [Bacteroidales bacterium OttesenSCG-928-C03]|nr:putative porin [Bacteroidales bacterium OttesenSCG-928-E04]MDL2309071.1 putative porin [Bacteroidales bacterium OttesenSCG-928-C03]MDL2326819.1 putative porin [Bacteroidales bacterium OttesenSCG-928-A14]
MNRIPTTTTLFLLIFTLCFSVLAQENHGDHQHEADSSKSQDVSPHYMPVKYTSIEPHHFTPLAYTNIDTSLINAHYYGEMLRVDNLHQSLGLLGQAHQKIGFDFHRDRGFTYINYPYPLLMKQQRDLRYYDMQTTFTSLAYTFGRFAENTFEAAHAQKIGQVNYGVTLNAYSYLGDFVNQSASYITGSFYLHYELPSKWYGFRIGYIINRFKNQENSGMMDAKLDTVDFYDYHAFLRHTADGNSSYAFNTPNATSQILTNDILLQQYVNLKFKKDGISIGYITHSFQYKNHKTKYTNTSLDTSRIENFYFSKDTTADSLHYQQVINTVQWSTFNPYHQWGDKRNFFHIAAGITHDYTEEIPRRQPLIDSITDAKGKRPGTKFTSNSATLFGRTYIRLLSVTDITGSLSYSFAGYNKNDAIADATISWAINRSNRHYIGFKGHFYRISPDYIHSYYSGNQLHWENERPKQNILQLSAFWCRKNIHLDFNYFMLNKYAYFDQNLTPSILEKSANVIQLNLYSPVRIRNFGFNTNLYLQHADNKVIQVPLFAGKASVYYLFNLFKRKMQIQIQTDLMFNTLYYADGYSPMLHQFYHQDSFENGNFLYLDANVNVCVDRIRFFFRISNVLAGVLGYNYFTTPYYPMENFRFQVGINWRFYD